MNEKDSTPCHSTSQVELSIEEPKVAPPPKYSAFEHPQRTVILFIICAAGFLGPVAGNIYIPLLPEFTQVFHSLEGAINGTVSAFMGVFAVAPIFWGLMSDRYGRKPGYVFSLGFYILASILLAAVPPNLAALYVLRVVQAIGAAGVMSIGAGTVADMIEPKKRATFMSYFMLGPQLGPVLGPILSLIAADGDWRWIFGFLAIIGGLVYIAMYTLLPETLRSLVGNGLVYLQNPKWLHLTVIQPKVVEANMPPRLTWAAFWRILRFPPVLLSSVISGLMFSTFYGVMVSFAQVLKEHYKFSRVGVSLSYLCPGASLVLGSLIAGRLSDYFHRRLGPKAMPESRFSLMFVGLFISMASVIGVGWVIFTETHVAALYVVVFFAGFGMTWVFIISTTYLTQCPTRQPATTVLIANMFRNVGAAIALAVMDTLIKKMGVQWCFTGLGLIDVIGLALSLLLVTHGSKWRKQYDLKYNS